MKLSIVDGDLLDQEVDVIVNAWNRNIIPWWLLIPQGVSGTIKKRGGTAPFRELAHNGPMPLGSAVETCAGRLPFKAIIHVAGINMLWRASGQSIRDSVRNALALARDHIDFKKNNLGPGRSPSFRQSSSRNDEQRVAGTPKSFS